MGFNRYSQSVIEYYEQGFRVFKDYLKTNIKPEFWENEIAKFIKNGEEYALAKEWYDSLTEEERLKYEIELFQQNLQREIKETKILRSLLFHGKTTDDNDNYNIDKTFLIASEYKEKKKYFEEQLKQKDGRLVSSLTPDQKDELLDRMIINEYGRLNNNLTSYKYFLTFLNSYYTRDKTEKVSDFAVFKTNILMFLLDVDYEKNTDAYSKYDFPNIPVSYITKLNRDGTEDAFTEKGKNKEYAKILRDAASHGEFYTNDQMDILASMGLNCTEEEFLNESRIVRVENSKGIPRIDFNLQYGILHNFVMDNLSDKTKEKYDFLIKIIEAKNFDDVLNDLTSNDLNQMLILMLNNVVQYNTEHHFKKTKAEINNLDLSMFSIFDDNNNGVDITSTLENEDILMNIKNALGHDNVTWSENEITLINDWVPTGENDQRPPKKNRIVFSKEQALEFILQNDLYNFSILSQVDNSTINRIK